MKESHLNKVVYVDHPMLTFIVFAFLYDDLSYYRELFIKDDGSMREAGDVIRMPLLARTLRQIATYGSETFYNGSLADDIVRDIQDRRKSI